MLDEQQQYNIENKVHVYVAEFDDAVVVEDVFPPIRNAAIAECADPLLKRQRYCVWRLLDYALREVIGKGVEDFNFTREPNGKWSCDGGVYFSLSHSRYAVAVAICLKESVGVDIEYASYDRFTDRLAERVLTDREKCARANCAPELQFDYLISCWTKKEAIFKRDGGKAFIPSQIETSGLHGCAKRVTMESGVYFVSAVSASNLPIQLNKLKIEKW